MRTFLVLAMVVGLSCRSAVPLLPPQAAALAGHLSLTERREFEAIRKIHEPGLGLIQRLRDSGLLADTAEWWVAGRREVLPFAGTWRGLAGVAEFQRQLDATMRYDKVELQEYLVSGNQVGVIFLGEGVARATGKPFRSEIVRLYTFEDGKVVRVRNFYDTASYVRAVRSEP
jgi:ketosteroid isomerase-like protein